MAREIDQIMQELEAAYAPQKKQYQEQISALPSYYQAQTAGLEQARQNAFQDIVRRANARGVVYSGAPIQEQQIYTGERYLPALANLSQQEGTQTFNLRQALNKIGETQRLAAEQIRQQELNREEAARQAEANRRAAAAAYGGFNFGPTGPSQTDAAGGGGIDYSAAAKGLAMQRLQDAKNAGLSNVKSGYREQVLAELQQNFGNTVPADVLNRIIYNEVFPVGWEGPRARVSTKQEVLAGKPYITGGSNWFANTALGNLLGFR